MKKNTILFVLFLLFSISVAAQSESSARAASHELITKGIGLYDEDDYKGALAAFNQISPADPNYAWALYEKALCYKQMDSLDVAYELCSKSYDLNKEDVAVTTFLGSLMDDIGKTGESIKFLEKAKLIWPYNANLLFNLGLCYINNNQPVEAEALLLQAIRFRPFHAGSHLALARANFMMGRKGEAYLASNMAILVNPRVSYLSTFEKMVTGKIDSVYKPYLYPYPASYEHKNWDYLNELMNSELAFNEKFEFTGKINYVTTRQSYLLFSSMQFNPNDPSFYNQFYLRFFKEVMNKGAFDTYLYYSFKEVKDDKILDWINKNVTELNAFVEWARTLLFQYRDSDYSFSNEEKKITMLHFDEDGNLNQIGELKTSPEEVKNGLWITINSDGLLKEKGTYVNNELQGEYLLYNSNGILNQQLQFKDSELEGICKRFHPNGQLEGTYPRAKSIRCGKELEYTLNGYPQSEYNYSDDKLNGTVRVYNYTTGFSRKMEYVNDKAEGKITEFWLNGKPKAEGAFRDSLLQGPLTTWYPTGIKETEVNYVNDTAVGKKIQYYQDGHKSAEMEFNEKGELTGKKTSFDRKGNISEQDDKYEHDLLNGSRISYYPSGKKASVQMFKGDSLIKITAYNGKGDIIYQDSLRNNQIYFKTFFENGATETEGLLKNGFMEGKWKYYYINGNVQNEFNYQNAMTSGEQRTFHSNGKPNEIYSSDSNYILGEYKKYYSTGTLESKGNFNKNGRDGIFIDYFSNEAVESIAFFDNSTLTGQLLYFTPDGRKDYEEYFNADGDPIRIITYDQNDKTESDLDIKYDSVTFKSHFANGKVKRLNNLADHLFNGVQEWYYPNGQLRTRLKYIHGKIEGDALTWDYHGTLIGKAPYVMNSLHGELIRYENGKVDTREIYEEGENQGRYTEYHSNGRVFRTMEFEDNKKNGFSTYYSPDSLLMHRFLFVNNVIQEISYQDKPGHFVAAIPVSRGRHEITTYFPTGAVSAKLIIQDGLLDGKQVTYYPNGKIAKEYTCILGDYEGVCNIYYDNGKLKESMTYLRDQLSGPYALYYITGLKHKEGRHLENQESGEWNIYNAAGKLAETLYYSNGDMYDIKTY
ncbi:MAG: hypothetical protein IPH88_16205 [Bacteroidales bacterium]|nr:hypothetical protein [Bacteroidales bacterium]